MSQHIDSMPTMAEVDALNSKITTKTNTVNGIKTSAISIDDVTVVVMNGTATADISEWTWMLAGLPAPKTAVECSVGGASGVYLQATHDGGYNLVRIVGGGISNGATVAAYLAYGKS